MPPNTPNDKASTASTKTDDPANIVKQPDGVKSADEMSEKELIENGLRGAGTVTNLADASGTRQLEPKPEDYPVAARILPPLEQVNPRYAQAVGTLAGREPTDDAIADGVKAHAANAERAVEGAQKIADLKRELDETLTGAGN